VLSCLRLYIAPSVSKLAFSSVFLGLVVCMFVLSYVPMNNSNYLPNSLQPSLAEAESMLEWIAAHVQCSYTD
jgi:hypothetical protein